MRSLSIAVLLLTIAAPMVRADDGSSADSSQSNTQTSTSQNTDTQNGDTQKSDAQKSDTSTKSPSPWLTPRDTWGGQKMVKKQQAAADEKAKAQAEAAKAAAMNADKAKAREDANLLRRLAVCDQLRLIASKTNDDTLARHADELDQRARDIYTQRVARLPIHMVVSKSDVQKAKQQKEKP
jgi:hypothetical protein